MVCVLAAECYGPSIIDLVSTSNYIIDSADDWDYLNDCALDLSDGEHVRVDADPNLHTNPNGQ